MNFLAHYVIATRILTVEPRPETIVGTALPDLLPLAEPRRRFRDKFVAALLPGSPSEDALRVGVLLHLATDAAFHKTDAFLRAQEAVEQLISQTAFPGMRVRRFFLAHVLVELALDSVLLRRDNTLAAGFYAAFDAGTLSAASQWSHMALGQALPTLPEVLDWFADERYLLDYTDTTAVSEGARRVSVRARQGDFVGPNALALRRLASDVVAAVGQHCDALLEETIDVLAGIHLDVEERAGKIELRQDVHDTIT